MKKILLFACAFTALSASAQIFEANDSAAFSVWTPYDLDMDGNNFIFAETGVANMATLSYSFINGSGAVTPDNLLVSPAIDLSTGSGLTLNFDVTAIDQSWTAEKYAVYIVTNVSALIAGTFPAALASETLSTGVVSKSIDISAVADGQATAYVVLRHFESTDNFAIGFNNLNITGDFVSVEENTLKSVNAYPNPATDVLNINTNQPVASVKVMTLDGKVVINNNSINSSFINLDVIDLEAGMYIYEIATADGKVARNSFVKK